MKNILRRAFFAALCGITINALGADYYGASGDPATGSALSSSVLRAEYSAIAAGFAKVAPYTSNASKAVIINSGGTGQTVTTGTLGLAGNFATTGAFNTTLIQGATTSLTLPLVSGTLATLAGTEELTNKTLNASVGKGTWTASGTWTLPALTLGGEITYGGVTLSNAVTGTGNMVLSASPTLTGTLTAAIANFSGAVGLNAGAVIAASQALTGTAANSTISGFLSVSATNFISGTTTTTAFAGATTLLTIGGTGASSVFAIPGTLDASGTTAALTNAGGFYNAKAAIIGGALTVSGQSNERNLVLTNAATSFDFMKFVNTSGTAKTWLMGPGTPTDGVFGIYNLTNSLSVLTLSDAGVMTIGGALIGPATATVFNTVSTTVNAFGAASTLNIGHASGTNTVLGATTFSQNLVASGLVGIGAAVSSDRFVGISGVSLTSGTDQYGLVVNPTFSSGATSSANNAYFRPKTAAAAFTVTNMYSVYADDVSKGAGSAVTNMYGLYVGNIVGGATLNYALYTNSGLVHFGGNVDMSGTLGVTGAITSTAGGGSFTHPTASAVYANSTLTGTSGTGVALFLEVNLTSGTGGSAMAFYNANAAAYKMFMLPNGDIQNANNSYGAISDSREKRDLGLMPSVLSNFKRLEWHQFNLLTDGDNAEVRYGVIAQQAQSLFPWVIQAGRNHKDEERLSANYMGLSIITGKALQENIVVTDDHERRLLALESAIKH